MVKMRHIRHPKKESKIQTFDFTPNPKSRDSKEQKKLAFLREFSKHGTISQTAEAVHIHRSTVSRWRTDDQAFAKAFEEVDSHVTDELEQCAINRAKSHSDTLLIFLLKARRPAIFSDNVRLENELRKFADKIVLDFTYTINKALKDYCPSCNATLGIREKLTSEFRDWGKKHGTRFS